MFNSTGPRVDLENFQFRRSHVLMSASFLRYLQIINPSTFSFSSSYSLSKRLYLLPIQAPRKAIASLCTTFFSVYIALPYLPPTVHALYGCTLEPVPASWKLCRFLCLFVFPFYFSVTAPFSFTIIAYLRSSYFIIAL